MADLNIDNSIRLAIKVQNLLSSSGLEKNWTAVPSRKLLERMKDRSEIDFIFHVGDIGYADDAFAANPTKFLYEESMNGYMNWIQNLTSVGFQNSAKLLIITVTSYLHVMILLVDSRRFRIWFFPAITSRSVTRRCVF